ncbi:chemotaxis-specific protein-glutamate methyltransferase CheB [Paucibacter sp. DJ1R-11]|uniref:chemotaxis-specific protein-glutamate methyltransferase CheB n=1 Tax=Paucibacter sp. DJ1R-11 TaxID=2893556 RepID=UPI0021E3F18C|nr:chemotaxis-specific protein-glutamate methyltransferase CheB [Paucibacter sp. DJ1R-11]MCV2361988.1 chemotaxis-specific protein-glutamate methyltransferase CheB [Paucibacter sp. DJ1R-11]
MIKLLIVDDSALMRRQLTQLFEAEGDYLIRQARNGAEAVEECRRFEPDVVTLDINMPEMDGITALSLIMAERPVPVVMVSSLTEKGALATFEALNLGAVDYVAKPGGTISLTLDQVRVDLLAKVRAAAKARVGRSRAALPKRPSPQRSSTTVGLAQRLREERLAASEAAAVEAAEAGRAKADVQGLLLIGVSTGGPRALEEVLPSLPANFPWPVLVAQHMPASFTAPFAARLDGVCPLAVVEVNRPMRLQAGTIYVGKGGADMVVSRRDGQLTAIPKPEAREHLWHPSVELLARSALECVPARHIVGVMLTGMGYDGADGFTAIKQAGGRTIAESEDTAVVFGMPAELIERGGASLVLPLDRVGSQLRAWIAH